MNLENWFIFNVLLIFIVGAHFGISENIIKLDLKETGWDFDSSD
jgi:hypothetical protein